MADENDPDYKLVRVRIMKWESYRSTEKAPGRYANLKFDLYVVRNPKKYPENYAVIPADLIDDRDEINAAVEHYFLCRAWIGNGEFSAAQMSAMVGVYNLGKRIGITPRNNPDNPTTPPSDLQKYFQQRGIDDGITDAKLYGTGAPPFSIKAPPKYF